MGVYERAPTVSVEAEATAFWDFALRLYAKPGVEADCLVLQDRDGVNVSLALLAVWLALRGRAVTADAAIGAGGARRSLGRGGGRPFAPC